MPPLKLTTESFVFNNSPYKGTTKVTAHKKKKTAKTAATSRQQCKPLKSCTPAATTVTLRSKELPAQVTRLLQGRCIYIEKKLQDYASLRELADAMGANVKETLDKTVTDYITDLKSGKKQLGATSNKGNRCVSPLWLVTCYQQQKYLPPINFPIDLQAHINTFPAVAPQQSATTAVASAINDDDNPFGLEEIDYDYLETRKPGYQLKMDGYITRVEKESNDAVSSDAETIPLQEEQDEGQREFFYNNNSSDDSNQPKRREETEEEIKARNKRNEDIRLTLSKAKSSASSSSSATNTSRVVTRSSSQKKTTKGLFGQQKFSVWYGEQEFKHLDSNKRS